MNNRRSRGGRLVGINGDLVIEVSDLERDNGLEEAGRRLLLLHHRSGSAR